MYNFAQIIEHITHSGIREGMGLMERRKVMLTNAIAFCTGVFVLCTVGYFVLTDVPLFVCLGLLAFSVICLSTFLLNSFLPPWTTKYLFIFNAHAVILLCGAYFSDGQNDIQIIILLWLLTASCLSFILFEIKKWHNLLFSFSITVISALLIRPLDTWLAASPNEFHTVMIHHPAFYFYNFLFCLGLTILSLILYQSSYMVSFKELIDSLKSKNKQLQVKEEELFQSLEQLTASQKEIKTSYELLQQKQRELQALASNVPGVIYNLEVIQNGISQFKYINPRAEEFFEYTADEILQNTNLLFNQIIPEYKAHVFEELYKEITDSTAWQSEFKIKTPSGHYKWLQGNAIIEPAYDGKTVINGVFIDITEQKKAYEFKEKMHDALLAFSNNESINTGDLEGSFPDLIKEVCKLLETDLISIWIFESNKMHCEYRYVNPTKAIEIPASEVDNEHIQTYLEYLKKSKILSAPNGQAHPLLAPFYTSGLYPTDVKSHLSADIVLNGDFAGVLMCEQCGTLREWTQDEIQFINSVSDIVSLALEISERRKAELEIQRTSALVLSVFESVDEGLVVISTDQQTVEFNNRFVEMFHLPPPLMLKENRRLRIRYLADQVVGDSDEFIEAVFEIDSNPEIKSFDILKMKDGRAIERYTQPFTVLGETKGRIWSYRDITTRLRTEEELRTVNKELDTFIYRASHDIKGPLARLRGICNVAKVNSFDDDAALYFNLLDTEAKRLDNILAKLLVVKDLKTSKIKTNRIHFADAIEKSMKYIRYLEDFKDVNLKLQIDHQIDFQSDENLLELIFMNLIDNAIQFRDISKSHIHIFIDISQEKNNLIIKIRDNGIGIEEHFLDKVFDMHFRGSERSMGTGLGLYIVKSSVDILKGRILVSSKEKAWTEFVILLPMDGRGVKSIYSTHQI